MRRFEPSHRIGWIVCWIVIVCQVSWGIATPPQADSGKDPRLAHGLQQIAELIRSGSLAEAEEIAAKLRSQFPNSAVVEQEYAAALAAQNKLNQATEHLQHAVELAPNSSAAHLNLGSNYFQRGLVAQAQEQFRIACRLTPADATAFYNLGLAEMQMEAYEAALKDFQQARRLQPSAVEISYYLSMAYTLAHRPADALSLMRSLPGSIQARSEFLIVKIAAESAISGNAKADNERIGQDFQYVLASCGGDPKAYVSASALLSALEDSRHAAKILEAAKERFPDQIEIEYLLALTYSRADQPQLAIDVLKSALAHSDSSELHSLYGKLLESQGDIVTAEHELQRAAELTPSESNIYELGYELLKHWSFEPAASVLESGLAKYPKSETLTVALATAYFASGKYDGAIDSLLRLDWVQKSPSVEALSVMLAAYPYSHAEPSKIRAFADSYARQHPAGGWGSYYLALIITEDPHHTASENEKVEAIRLLQQAVALDPKIAQFHFQLGVALLEDGQCTAAAKSLRSVVALDSNLPEAWYRLALAEKRSGNAEESQRAMARYVAVSKRADSEVQERMAQTTKFLSSLPQ